MQKAFNFFTLNHNNINNILRIQDIGKSIDISDDIFLSKNGVFRLPTGGEYIELADCGNNILELSHKDVKAHFPYCKTDLAGGGRFILKNSLNRDIGVKNQYGILMFVSTKGGEVSEKNNTVFLYEKNTNNHQHYIIIFRNLSSCKIKTSHGEAQILYNGRFISG